MAKENKDKPIARSFGQRLRNGLGFSRLKETPGVTVTSESIKIPNKRKGVTYRRGTWFKTKDPLGGFYQGVKSAFSYIFGVTDPESTSYSGMQKFYAEYRRDMLVRRCINLRAAFSTRKGFQTVLEPPEEMEEEESIKYCEEYEDLKAYIDDINEKVEFDKMLYIAVIKAKIYGHVGFEIVPWGDGGNKALSPERLIRLKSEDLEPEVSKEFELTSFKYENNESFYEPEDLIYITNNELESDFRGLSDIEPVMDSLESRRTILAQSIKEAATVLWAGVAWIQVNTQGMTDSAASSVLTDIENAIKPGKYIITNNKIEKVEITDLKPNMEQLIKTLDYLDNEIIGNFETPKFMVGREKQFNRATAFAELQSYIDGPINRDREWIKREVEHQWFDVLTDQWLRIHGKTKEGEKPPIHVRLEWDPISTEDISELFEALAKAYEGGMGWLTQKKCWEIAGFDTKELEEEEMEEFGPPEDEASDEKAYEMLQNLKDQEEMEDGKQKSPSGGRRSKVSVPSSQVRKDKKSVRQRR